MQNQTSSITPRNLITAVIGLMLVFTLFAATGESAKKAKKSAAKLPSISSINPTTASVGQPISVKGKNFVKGKNKMIVLLKTLGGHRITTRATAKSSTEMEFLVPQGVINEMVNQATTKFKIRLVSKFGLGSKWTDDKRSVSVTWTEIVDLPANETDCDRDGVLNSAEADDDNDLLPDTKEAQVGTNPCVPDTDADISSDYYEVRVAEELNGGPVLPYPGRMPFPNPLVQDSNNDFDGDQLANVEEYRAWQLTKRMDRFYNDADQDSDNNGVYDEDEDVDNDLMPNIVELREFTPGLPSAGGAPQGNLDYLVQDTDGDGLCDGLDDQDHDGPPTPVAQGDCTSAVPNNVSPGDPNGLTDGDDNIYSNWYEWFYTGYSNAFNPCAPDVYPTSPFCPHL